MTAEAGETPLLEVQQRTPEDDRVFNLLLFEAEEFLARGSGDKALVLSSRAVKERPDSLTARALMERARRDLLRGRRREKLDARLREAEASLVSGDLKAAEKIILSALKVVPDHELAQELFRRLKEARMSEGSVEAEAEQELQRLAQAEVKRAVEAARAAREAGWEGKALLSIRRGLRVVPDAPELLGMLSEAQESADAREGDRSRRLALISQVRAGQELLRRGQIGESLKILRAVLEEDPDNARAQAAVQEVRRAWLARQAPQQRTEPETSGGTPERPLRGVLVPQTVVLARPEGAPEAAPLPQRPAKAIPAEIRLSRNRRRSNPMPLILGCVAVVAVGVVVWREGSTAPAPVAPSPVDTPPPLRAVAVPDKPPEADPLDGLDPDLRKTIEDTLGSFAHALESHDGALLAQVRPDLSAKERTELLAPFEDALDATVSLRVLDVTARGDEADVDLRRQETIVRGRVPPHAPAEETLRFERQKGVWALRPSRER
jgi:hypothetical protein